MTTLTSLSFGRSVAAWSPSAFPPGQAALCIHDVSELNYNGHHAKNDRKPIGDGNTMGYEYHPCVLLDPDTEAFVGIAHDTLVDCNGPDDRDVMAYDYEPLFDDFDECKKRRLYDNFRHQCAVHIHGLAKLFPQQHLIHVADREYDDVFVFLQALDQGHDFVIRSKANRNVQMPDCDWLPQQALTAKQTGHPLEQGCKCVNLSRAIDAVPLAPYKTLRLDHRGRVVRHAKHARNAKLSIGACRLKLYRDAIRNAKYFKLPRPVELNMVVIRETHPPDGQDPLCWVLFTTLPVDTLEQLAFIARCYELRWRIEEYFKLIKCGYNIERIRLNSAAKNAKLLVILSIAAMILLDLKSQLGLPAAGPLDEPNYNRVKHAANNLNDPTIDLSIRLFAHIAIRGGWNARMTDPIGPDILMRGMLQTFAIVHAYINYRDLLQELVTEGLIRHPKNAYN